MDKWKSYSSRRAATGFPSREDRRARMQSMRRRDATVEVEELQEILIKDQVVLLDKLDV